MHGLFLRRQHGGVEVVARLRYLVPVAVEARRHLKITQLTHKCKRMRNSNFYIYFLNQQCVHIDYIKKIIGHPKIYARLLPRRLTIVAGIKTMEFFFLLNHCSI